jgi:hypothetical protein
LIFATVRSFGLPDWRPDLLGGTPTSLYNGALENIALWTFEQAATSFAYAHLSPNMRYIHDTSLIQKLYKNFLWSYMKGLALKEQKESGSVSRGLQENKAYKARIEVCEMQVIYIQVYSDLVLNSLQIDGETGCGTMGGMIACSSWPLRSNVHLTRSRTQMVQGS